MTTMNSGIGRKTSGIALYCQMPLSWRLSLVGVVAVIGLAGCTGTVASPAVSPLAVSSVMASAIASPTPGLIETPTSNASPTAQPLLTFVATGSMHIARSSATATLLKSAKVLIAGGAKVTTALDEDVYASAELYDPATGKFSPTGSMTAARSSATATLLPDGRVLITGGEGCSDPLHCSHVGHGNGLDFLASAELYNPTTGKFSATGSMTGASELDTAITLPDGRILIAGFNQWAELYDPNSGKFLRTAKNAGFQAAATLLPNGKVLLAGSHYVTNSGVGSLYDAANGKFATVSLALPAGTIPAQYKGVPIIRAVPSIATLLKDGRVLLFEGGYLETYDPASGACADAGFISPAGEWDYATATLMADGRVLYEGGDLVDPFTGELSSTNTAVLYDATGGPIRKGSTPVALDRQTATLLPDGSVLIAGGEDKDGKPLVSADLFKP
jgi:hypothetical protein